MILVRSQIASLIDIHDEMLLLNTIEFNERRIKSSATFDVDFYPFRLHISKNKSSIGPLPGIFIIECMAQTAVAALKNYFPTEETLISQINTILASPVWPGELLIECALNELEDFASTKIKISLVAKQSNVIVARATLTYTKLA